MGKRPRRAMQYLYLNTPRETTRVKTDPFRQQHDIHDHCFRLKNVNRLSRRPL